MVNRPKPTTKHYDELISDIHSGKIKLPKFQRNFVWTLEQSSKLIDSILKGYPIGTFIFWKTRSKLAEIKEIGGLKLKSDPNTDQIQYVLDGQQRLVSLFLSIIGHNFTEWEDSEIKMKKIKKYNYKNICINLDCESNDEDLVTIQEEFNDKNNFISIYDLLDPERIELQKNRWKSYSTKIYEYQSRFLSYDFAVIELSDYPIEQVVDIFTRINTSGKDLNAFDIMVARTYDENIPFDLYKKYDKFMEEIEEYLYNVPTAQVLQSIAVNIKGDCKTQTILKLDKIKFINNYEVTVKALKKTIVFLQESWRIPSRYFLPYPALLVPLQYFFIKNKKDPNNEQEKMLKEYFWRSALTNRFSSAVHTKLGADIKKIDQIIKNERPTFENEFHVHIPNLNTVKFNLGDAVCKSILCVLAYFKPKLFDRANTFTHLESNALAKSTSRNYHHFFPRAYLKEMKEKKIEGYKGDPNSIANITLISEDLNKRIGKKAPSKYMKEFQQINENINKVMETHLINDMTKFGVLLKKGDNYDTFLKQRSSAILDELKKRYDPFRV